MKQFTLQPGQLGWTQLRDIWYSPVRLTLGEETIQTIQRAADTVQHVIESGKTVYGINTGFGLLANTKIARDELELLQSSIVRSHAAGTGKLMDDAIVRLMLVLKINSLSRGFSGIRVEVIQFLCTLLANEVYPCIPEKGSVGASGDLAPLAHLCLPMLGEGQVRYQGKIYEAEEGLKFAGLSPIPLAAKEGLALLNGTQASTAFAIQGLFHTEALYQQGTLIGAMTLEAALGSRVPFDSRIHEVRGQQGQIDAATMYRNILGDPSEICLSHQHCDKVQDPYSLRCQPQVMGACLTQIRHAASVILTEANGVTDNPLVFANEDEILSGGNFHAEPIAMAADNLALAIAEIGALAERRIALMMDSQLSQLPPFLVENGGVNSGFMIAQVTAAALASENKTFAHPGSVDSLPTSANQEDHVSMATFCARRLTEMAENTRGVLAVEYLSAAQGLDFRAPLKSSPSIEQAKHILRETVSYYDKDRYFGKDIEAATSLLANNALTVVFQPTLF